MRMNYLALAALVWLAPPSAAAGPSLDDAMATASAAASAEFETLDNAVREAMTAHYAGLRKMLKEAEEAGEPRPTFDVYEPLHGFLPKFQAAADTHKGTEDAVQFLVWIAEECGEAAPEAAQSAFATLIAAHATSPGLEPLADTLPNVPTWFGAERGRAMLAKLQDKTPVAALRTWSAYGMYAGAMETADVESEEYAEARRMLMALADSEGKSQVASMIRSGFGLRETFAIGQVAPDIAGIDLNGAEFKLSDYEGKVVFLDFWGNW